MEKGGHIGLPLPEEWYKKAGTLARHD